MVSEAIGKYIQLTRYRQIIETESAKFLLLKEQEGISEDQKHSSNVARVHYQKKRSREFARGRQSMVTNNLFVKSKNLDEQDENIEHSLAARDDVQQDTPIVCTSQTMPRREGIRMLGLFKHFRKNG